MMNLVGREKEKEELRQAFMDNHSQFAAVYGRRRVGKTYLIREFFKGGFTFQHAGVYSGNYKDQLAAFSNSLTDAGLKDFKEPSNWMEAFECLKKLIRQSKKQKKVIFIDELSWMDTSKSNLIMALENFWNGWASARDDVFLIVCSSVTSWMMNKVIHNKGGLYNRLTLRLHLEPFTLYECREFVKQLGVVMTDYQVMEAYMILGGVPYYWGFLKKNLSLSQNMDHLFFEEDAPLSEEYEHLFSSLFRRPEDYIAVIEALTKCRKGLTREDILKSTGLKGSGTFSGKLLELEHCGFIRKYRPFGKKEKGSVYQLMDPFTIFYYHFMKRKPGDEHFWTNLTNSPKRNAWSGFAFERVCLLHVKNIKKALGISGVLTDICSFNCTADPEKGIRGSQIDLVIERKDNVINLLEMKFSYSPYVIQKKTAEDLQRKKEDFIIYTGTRSALHLTMVTPFGIAENSYSGDIQSQITAGDLFTV